MDITNFDLKAFDAHDNEVKNVRASTAASWRAYFEGKGEPEAMVASIKQQGDELAIAVSKEVGKAVVITRVYCDASFVIVEFVAPRCTCNLGQLPSFEEIQQKLGENPAVVINLMQLKSIWGKLKPGKPDTPLAALIHAKAVLRRWVNAYAQRVCADNLESIGFMMSDLHTMIGIWQDIQKNPFGDDNQDVKPT